MNNENVTLEDLGELLSAPCHLQDLDHVVLVQDTTQYNFEAHRGRFSADDADIGVLGDNRSLGLFVHPTLGFDEATGIPFGITDLAIYQLPEDRELKANRGYTKQPITEKHSYRWIKSIEDSVAKMPKVKNFTAIADREADMYELFAHPFDSRVKLLIRSAQNRKLANGQLLHAYLDDQPWQGEYELEIKGNKKRCDRTAQMTIRWSTVEVVCPSSLHRLKKDHPATISIQAIEVKEIEAGERAEGEEPLHWYLYTTHEVTNLVQALQAVEWYVKRWWIEDFFRLTKSQGFELEKSQFSSGMALKRLIYLVYGEAIKVLALRQGRTLTVSDSARLVFDNVELLLLKALLPKLEGRTASQANQNPTNSIAWAVWIIARLGGWTPRNINVRPPGVITLLSGLKIFKQRLEGFKLIYSQISP
ncbi:IS4 family transposase [Lewinella lacunae]|uniref:IS4 family transposase n=1 Tax=Neolewinella lacunae TaxID=1517758 RepID=A0A923TCH5_9BACT|nr:IS4 family transposase [Neolewinella lacunae]MBC6992953.1 IS4 family transposase [Neolewinella lacunae]MBC6993401.1 IS4 family transposase [Neolewinella lacunae]MBC6993580.1 IS4 family transposase [Neolewinella lacunae]MBC6993612.1 IS4 family transposase [Neolewinella lacunae]MBC6993660.1 IS4 family transposase [Neolewinella lacunae]